MQNIYMAGSQAVLVLVETAGDSLPRLTHTQPQTQKIRSFSFFFLS